MGAIVICMASAKGGSGKTVLTATFSAFLAALGKRVLMIDTDAATNGLTLMYLKETMVQADEALSQNRVASGVYEAWTRKGEPELVKLTSGVHLLPAAYQFQNTESVDVQHFEASLVHTLELFRQNYDFIFLDAQAGSDSFARVAMGLSKQVVIVSEYDPLSAAGVERLKALFPRELSYGRTWVLLNKMLPDFVQSFSDFMEVARYASPIPWDAEVVRAYARRRLALDLERGNEFTLAVLQTLRSILGDAISQELDNWVSSRTAALREPIRTQYEDTERELETLIREQAETRSRNQGRRFNVQLLSVILPVVVSVGISFLPFTSDFIYRINREFSLPTSVGILIVQAFVFSLALWVSFKGFRSIEHRSNAADREVLEERIQRQREILTERLKRLEALRSADASALLRNKI